MWWNDLGDGILDPALAARSALGLGPRRDDDEEDDDGILGRISSAGNVIASFNPMMDPVGFFNRAAPAAMWLMETGNKYVTRPVGGLLARNNIDPRSLLPHKNIGTLPVAGQHNVAMLSLLTSAKDSIANRRPTFTRNAQLGRDLSVRLDRNISPEQMRRVRSADSLTGSYEAAIGDDFWNQLAFEAIYDPWNLAGAGAVGGARSALVNSGRIARAGRLNRALQWGEVGDEFLNQAQTIPFQLAGRALKQPFRGIDALYRRRSGKGLLESSAAAMVESAGRRLSDILNWQANTEDSINWFRPEGDVARRNVDDLNTRIQSAQTDRERREIIRSADPYLLGRVYLLNPDAADDQVLRALSQHGLGKVSAVSEVDEAGNRIQSFRFIPSDKLQAHAQLDETFDKIGYSPDERRVQHEVLDIAAENLSRQHQALFPTPDDAYRIVNFRWMADARVNPDGRQLFQDMDQNAERVQAAFAQLEDPKTIEDLLSDERFTNAGIWNWYARSGELFFHLGFDHSPAFTPEQVEHLLNQDVSRQFMQRFGWSEDAARAHLSSLTKIDAISRLIGAGSMKTGPARNLYMSLNAYRNAVEMVDAPFEAAFDMLGQYNKAYTSLLNPDGLLEMDQLDAALPYGGAESPVHGDTDKMHLFAQALKEETDAVAIYYEVLLQTGDEQIASRARREAREAIKAYVSDIWDKRGMVDLEQRLTDENLAALRGETPPVQYNKDGTPKKKQKTEYTYPAGLDDLLLRDDTPHGWFALKSFVHEHLFPYMTGRMPGGGPVVDGREISPNAAANWERYPNVAALQAHIWIATRIRDTEVTKKILQRWSKDRAASAREFGDMPDEIARFRFAEEVEQGFKDLPDERVAKLQRDEVSYLTTSRYASDKYSNPEAIRGVLPHTINGGYHTRNGTILPYQSSAVDEILAGGYTPLLQDIEGVLARGVYTRKGGRATIGLTSEADTSTLAHELLGHLTRQFTSPQQKDLIRRAFGKPVTGSEVEFEEWYARGVENLLRTGTPESGRMVDFLERYRSLLRFSQNPNPTTSLGDTLNRQTMAGFDGQTSASTRGRPNGPSPLLQPNEPVTPANLEEVVSGRRGNFAILTAERQTPEDAARNAALVRDIEALGFHAQPVRGHYDEAGTVESSFFVHGIPPDVAAELGRKYDQEAIIIADGMYYTGGDDAGILIPNAGVSVNGPEQMYYSELLTEEGAHKFAMQLDWDNPQYVGDLNRPLFQSLETPLYHGTREQFDRFESGRGPSYGVYLTDDADLARQYAEDAGWKSGNHPRVIEVDVDLGKVIDLTDERNVVRLAEQIGMKHGPTGQELIERFGDEVRAEFPDFDSWSVYDQVQAVADHQGIHVPNTVASQDDATILRTPLGGEIERAVDTVSYANYDNLTVNDVDPKDEFLRGVHALGYDAAIVQDYSFGKYHRSYVVFDPQRINITGQRHLADGTALPPSPSHAGTGNGVPRWVIEAPHPPTNAEAGKDPDTLFQFGEVGDDLYNYTLEEALRSANLVDVGGDEFTRSILRQIPPGEPGLQVLTNPQNPEYRWVVYYDPDGLPVMAAEVHPYGQRGLEYYVPNMGLDKSRGLLSARAAKAVMEYLFSIGASHGGGPVSHETVRLVHKAGVRKALEEGIPVSDAVLADYPDLAKRFGRAVSPNPMPVQFGGFRYAHGTGVRSQGDSMLVIESPDVEVRFYPNYRIPDGLVRLEPELPDFSDELSIEAGRFIERYDLSKLPNGLVEVVDPHNAGTTQERWAFRVADGRANGPAFTPYGDNLFQTPGAGTGAGVDGPFADVVPTDLHHDASVSAALTRAADHLGVPRAQVEPVTRIVEEINALADNPINSFELLATVARDDIEAALRATDDVTRRQHVATAMDALNQTMLSIGAAHPMLVQVIQSVAPKTFRKMNPVTTGALGRQRQGSHLPDEMVTYLRDARQLPRLNQLIQTYQRALSMATETANAARASNPLIPPIDEYSTIREVSEMVEKFGNANQKKAIRAFVKTVAPESAQKAFREAYLETAVEAHIKDMAAQHGVDLSKEPSWLRKAQTAWREQALMSVRRHTQDSLDMMFKSAVQGVNPVLPKTAFVKAQRRGIPIPGSVAVMQRSTITGEGMFDSPASRGVLTQIPVLGRGVQANKWIARAQESTFRIMAWDTAYEKHMRDVFLPRLPGEVRRVGKAAGVDASAVDEVVRDFQKMGVDLASEPAYERLVAAGFDTRSARGLSDTILRGQIEASDAGAKFSDKVHFPVGDEREIERILHLRDWLPFHYWMTRNVPYYIETLAQHPYLLRAWSSYYEAAEEERVEAGLPSRFRFQSAIPGGMFIDEVLGPGKIFFNPMVALSFADQFRPAFIEEDQTLLGKVIDNAGQFGFSPAPWVSIPLEMLGVYGHTEPRGVLRHSTLIDDITGVDVEAPLKAGIKAATDATIEARTGQKRAPTISGNAITDYNITKRIAELSIEETGRPNDPRYLRAMADPNSLIYQRARRDVEREKTIMDVVNFFLPSTARVLRPTEERVRAAQTTLGDNMSSETYRALAESGHLSTGYWNTADNAVEAQITAGFNSPYVNGTRRTSTPLPWFNEYLNWLSTQPEYADRSVFAFMRAMQFTR